MIFSQRYHRALKDKRLTVIIPDDVRPKLATGILKHDSATVAQRDYGDRWMDETTAVEGAILELMSEHGWHEIPGMKLSRRGKVLEALRYVILQCNAEIVFDFIELAIQSMNNVDREECGKKVNQIFDLHDCAWRIIDGEFCKLDAEFMGARLAADAHDALVVNRFAGAADEYAKARQELAAGDAKACILRAGNSIESVMKAITGSEHGSAPVDQGNAVERLFRRSCRKRPRGFCRTSAEDGSVSRQKARKSRARREND